MQIERRLPPITEYTRLRELVRWWEIDKNVADTALKNSLFSVVAIEHGTVVGLGRIIGDGGLYFYIQNLIVQPDFQNKGLGKSLMKKLMDYIMANAKSGAFVGLMAAKGLEKWGGSGKIEAISPKTYRVT